MLVFNKEKKGKNEQMLTTVGGCRDTHKGAAPESSSGQWCDRNEREAQSQQSPTHSSEWMQTAHAKPGLNVRACVNNEIMGNFNMDCSMPVYRNTDDAS